MAQATEKHYTIINANCDAEGTYNFNVDRGARIGHIRAMSFTTSQKELLADTPLSDPENPDGEVQVVAVIEAIQWVGGPTDPIVIRGRFSPANRGTILEALSAPGGGSDVDIQFNIYDFDHKEKKHFLRFHTDGKPVKTVLTEGVRVSVDEDPDTVIQQPVNFNFELSLTGKSSNGKQELCCATSATQKFTRQFGVAVS